MDSTTMIKAANEYLETVKDTIPPEYYQQILDAFNAGIAKGVFVKMEIFVMNDEFLKHWKADFLPITKRVISRGNQQYTDRWLAALAGIFTGEKSRLDPGTLENVKQFYFAEYGQKMPIKFEVAP